MKRITFCYAFLLGLITLLADAGTLRPILQPLQEIPLADKALHFLLVGILALFVNLSIRRWAVASVWAALVPGSLAVAVASALEESSNIVVDGRNWSLGDLAANLLGVLCLGIVPLIVYQFQARRHPVADLGGSATSG